MRYNVSVSDLACEQYDKFLDYIYSCQSIKMAHKKDQTLICLVFFDHIAPMDIQLIIQLRQYIETGIV